MTVRQLAVLHRLTTDSLTMTELAEQLNLNKTAISRVLDRLETWDFVVWRVSETDKRKVEITLSNKAQQFLSEYDNEQ